MNPVWRHQGRLPGGGRCLSQALKDRWGSTKQQWGHALRGGDTCKDPEAGGNVAAPTCQGVLGVVWQGGIKGEW